MDAAGSLLLTRRSGDRARFALSSGSDFDLDSSFGSDFDLDLSFGSDLDFDSDLDPDLDPDLDFDLDFGSNSDLDLDLDLDSTAWLAAKTDGTSALGGGVNFIPDPGRGRGGSFFLSSLIVIGQATVAT